MPRNNIGLKMKYLALLCVVALAMGASAEYSFDIISSGTDNVIFEYACSRNSDCMSPGEEFCGKGNVKTVLCRSFEGRCEVSCDPLQRRDAEEKGLYDANIIITPSQPSERRAGREISVLVKDTRGDPFMNWGVDVYYGGRWDTEVVEGSTYRGQLVIRGFMESFYVDGELEESLYTDRQGKTSFTPDKPGFYVIYSADKYLSFYVADESGEIMECGNGICERNLGEDEKVCPEDCAATGPAITAPETGDTTDTGETPEPVDPEPVVQVPESTQPSESGVGPVAQGVQTPQEDNRMLLLIIIIIATGAVVAVLLIVYMKKGKGPKGSAVAAAQAAPLAQTQASAPGQAATPVEITCPKCGAKNPGGSTFCIKCGERLK
jgi:hypothetical protein